MVGYTGLKENFIKIIDRDEALIISWRDCLIFCCVLKAKKKKKKKIVFKISIYFQPLSIEFF